MRSIVPAARDRALVQMVKLRLGIGEIPQVMLKQAELKGAPVKPCLRPSQPHHNIEGWWLFPGLH